MTTTKSKSIVQGEVQVGRHLYRYGQWAGERCCSRLLSIDTETEYIEDMSATVPRLAVAQFYDGDMVYLVHPDDMGEFVLSHDDCNFVMHNVAFDFWVIYRHLIQNGQRKAARRWLGVADDDRMTDTMLLDQLVRIAYGSVDCSQRSLDRLASHYLDLVEIDKQHPWRRRFGEIIDADWSTVPNDAWEYAAGDAVVTRDIFRVLRDKQRRLVRQHKISQETIDEFGPLTIRVQVKAAIALRAAELRGISIDETKRDSAKENLSASIATLVAQLDADETFRGIFKRDNNGELLVTPTGKPRTKQKQLRQVLSQIAEEHDLTPHMTASGDVSLAGEYWQEHADVEPFIQLWVDLERQTKLSQFFTKLDKPRVHPGYTTMVRTGRTSCKRPNIQQIPRQSSFREMFVPRDGHVFLIIDYASLELRTLAAVCESLYGYSVLAGVIRDNTDPHRYTAALLNSCEIDEVTKSQRQAAKAVNFGIPGGLGAQSLSAYARINYGVTMSFDDAERFREKFLSDVYPEIGEYMASDTMHILAENLQCKVKDIQREFTKDSILGATKRIVSGKPFKRADTEPYNETFVQRCWKSLVRLNQNEQLEIDLNDQLAGSKLERRLFFGSSMCPGGFVRGRTAYTQRRNTRFQSAAATGAKIAAWCLFRRGYRTVAFVHDEFVVELPVDADFESECKLVDEILCRAMERLTDKVPIETEYAIASCWSKAAELIRDDNGRIQVWRPSS